MPVATTLTHAPSFELPGTDTTHFSLSEGLRHGPILLAFFKVSCPTCHFTFPFLERLYQQFRRAGGQVWSISQDNAADSREFAREFGITFPILIDAKPYPVSKSYRVAYTPTLFLISPGGRIEISSDGFSKADLVAIQRWFATHYSLTPPPLFDRKEKIPEYKPG